MHGLSLRGAYPSKLFAPNLATNFYIGSQAVVEIQSGNELLYQQAKSSGGSHFARRRGGGES